MLNEVVFALRNQDILFTFLFGRYDILPSTYIYINSIHIYINSIECRPSEKSMIK